MSQDNNKIKIYKNFERVKESLKKKYRHDRRLFHVISKQQRFPFVALEKDKHLDKKAKTLKRQLELETIGLSECSNHTTSSNSSKDTHETSKKHKKFKSSSRDDLLALNMENEQLDFEESEEIITKFEIQPKIQIKKEKQTDNNKCAKQNAESIRDKNIFDKDNYNKNYNNKNVLNSFNKENKGSFLDQTNCLKSEFKIPKKTYANQNEKIVHHVEGLIKNARYNDAYNYLTTHLIQPQNADEDIWKNEQVVQLIAQICLGMAKSVRINSDFEKLHQSIQRIMFVEYVESNFWNDLVTYMDSSLKRGNNVHLVRKLLSEIYGYLFEKKIRFLQLQNETLIMSYYYIRDLKINNKPI